MYIAFRVAQRKKAHSSSIYPHSCYGKEEKTMWATLCGKTWQKYLNWWEASWSDVKVTGVQRPEIVKRTQRPEISRNPRFPSQKEWPVPSQGGDEWKERQYKCHRRGELSQIASDLRGSIWVFCRTPVWISVHSPSHPQSSLCKQASCWLWVVLWIKGSPVINALLVSTSLFLLGIQNAIFGCVGRSFFHDIFGGTAGIGQRTGHSVVILPWGRLTLVWQPGPTLNQGKQLLLIRGCHQELCGYLRTGYCLIQILQKRTK